MFAQQTGMASADLLQYIHKNAAGALAQEKLTHKPGMCCKSVEKQQNKVSLPA